MISTSASRNSRTLTPKAVDHVRQRLGEDLRVEERLLDARPVRRVRDDESEPAEHDDRADDGDRQRREPLLAIAAALEQQRLAPTGRFDRTDVARAS